MRPEPLNIFAYLMTGNTSSVINASVVSVSLSLLNILASITFKLFPCSNSHCVGGH